MRSTSISLPWQKDKLQTRRISLENGSISNSTRLIANIYCFFDSLVCGKNIIYVAQAQIWLLRHDNLIPYKEVDNLHEAQWGVLQIAENTFSCYHQSKARPHAFLAPDRPVKRISNEKLVKKAWKQDPIPQPSARWYWSPWQKQDFIWKQNVERFLGRKTKVAINSGCNSSLLSATLSPNLAKKHNI